MYYVPPSAFQPPRPQPKATPPAPSLYHAFEDTNAMQTGQQQQQQPVNEYPPQQQQQQYYQPQEQQGYPPAQPTSYAPEQQQQQMYPAQSMYPQPDYTQQQQTAYPPQQTEYMPQQQASYPPQQQQQQQQQYQQQAYPPAQQDPYQSYAPAPAHAPPVHAPPGASNPTVAVPDTIKMCSVELASRNVAQPSEHPSIPRLMPQHIYEDRAFRSPAPHYIKPVDHASVRPTMHTFPSTQQLADSLKLPVGVTLNPFADTNVPSVHFSALGNKVIRCRRCSAYINPFTTFSEGGRKWQCILCRALNETPREYYCGLDENGIRRDIANRPELVHGSVDLIATPEFLKTPPRRPIQLLVLDCSPAAVSSGLLAAVCKGALAALEKLKDDEVMRYGIVGYDSTVYFFNLKPTLRAPRMVAAPETVKDITNINDNFKLDAIELPCPINDLVVPIKESYHLIKELLEKLPALFADTEQVGCAFGPALAAAISMLENNGGKILSTICSMPSVGEGKLKKRFQVEKLSKQPKEYTMLTAANDWYKQRALACSTGAISVDIVTGNEAEEMDLATIAPLARYTCGHIYRATPQNMTGITPQIERMLTRFTAFDAILRIRSSHGLVIPNFYGHCHVREPDLLSLPVGDQDSSFTVELSIRPSFKSNFAYLQFAVMYTSRERERRIRVHTLQVRASPSLGHVVNSINSIGMACFLTKVCVDEAVSMPFVQARENTTTRLVTALKAANAHAALQGIRPGAGQLLLPASMLYIPQIINGFFRDLSIGQALSLPISPDARIHAIAAVMSTPPEAMLPGYLGWTYQVYSPHTPVDKGPAAVYSSKSYLSGQSIVVTTLRDAFLLWYGKRANPVVLDAFHLSPEDPNAMPATNEPELSQEELHALRDRTEALLRELRSISSPAFRCMVLACPSRSSFEGSLARALVEDDQVGILSYKTFLDNLMKRTCAA